MTSWRGAVLPLAMLACLFSVCGAVHSPALRQLPWPSPRWHPARNRRLLEPGNSPDSSIGNSSSSGSGGSGADSSSDPPGRSSPSSDTNSTAQSLQGGSGNASTSCPTINIFLRALQVIHPMVGKPGSEVLVRCQTNTGRLYKWYTIPLESAYDRSFSDAKFNLLLGVAQLKCGEAMSCRVGGQWPSDSKGGTESEILFDWGSSGCWFQYGHFTGGPPQGSPLWSCKDPMAGEYVLQCAECSAGGVSGEAPSGGSSQGVGARGSGINPTVIIIATCVCSATAIIVGLGLLVRHRRRTRSLDHRIVDLLRRSEAREGAGGRSGRPPPNFKPPPLYRLEAGEAQLEGGEELGAGGGDNGEARESGLQVPPLRDNPPPPGYKGPIVVINYDGSSGLGEAMMSGAVVLAKPDFPSSRRHRHHRRSHRRRRAVPALLAPEDGSGGADTATALAAAAVAGSGGGTEGGDGPSSSSGSANRNGGSTAAGDEVDLASAPDEAAGRSHLPFEVTVARGLRSPGGAGVTGAGSSGSREQRAVSRAPPYLQSSLLAQLLLERDVEQQQRLRAAQRRWEREAARDAGPPQRQQQQQQPRQQQGGKVGGQQGDPATGGAPQQGTQQGERGQHGVVVASEVGDDFEEVRL